MAADERESRSPLEIEPPCEAQAGYRGLGRFAILFVVTLITFLITMGCATQARFVSDDNAVSSKLLPALYLFLVESTWAWTWILPAIGFGRFISARFLRPATLPFSTLSFGIGAAFLMFADHVLGSLGVFQFAGGAPVFVLTATGIVLIFFPRTKRGRGDRPFTDDPFASFPFIAFVVLTIFITIPVSLLFTAALSTPGYLWDSEFGGFDALSYHLQLPREWVALGRIAPLRHNVYSYLPSYMESAYYHLAVLRRPFKDASADAMQSAAYAAQLLHAYFVIFAAAGLAELFYKFAHNRASRNSTKSTTASTITRTLLATAFIAIPWITVVGSLAYNEISTILFFVAALQIITGNQSGLSNRSEVAIGFLLGSACAVKLTSFGLVAIPCLLLFVVTNLRSNEIVKSLLRSLSMIALGGFVVLFPYALRNLVATDFTNPFFPFATSIFGTAHWTSEQVARFKSAHTSEDFTFLDRLDNLWRMAFLDLQWAYLWFIALTAGLVALFIKSTQRGALMAFVLLIPQIVFWLLFTHMQSRFLIPCVIPLMLMVGLPNFAMSQCQLERATSHRLRSASARAFPVMVAGVVCAFFIGLTFRNYADQHDGAPAAMIDAMPLSTGLGLLPETQEVFAERNPVVFLNLNILRLRGGSVYLLGDSTPFYLNPAHLYHTTWDTSPLGRLIVEYPDHPDRWAQQLAEQYDVRYVLINWSELARLIEKDHWYDPNVTLLNVRILRDAGSTRLIRNWPRNHELLEIMRSR